MWHNDVQEVKSGQLIAPGIPQVAEHALMEKLDRHLWEDLAYVAYRPRQGRCRWAYRS